LKRGPAPEKLAAVPEDPAFAYLFKKFPVFAQTFTAREIEGLGRHGVRPRIYALYASDDAASQEGFADLAGRVEVVPGGWALGGGVLASALDPRGARGAVLSGGWLGPARRRRREALWLGPRLRGAGVRHVHVHFTGPAARTAWWLHQDFGLGYSITAHANDFLCEDEGEPSLARLLGAARFVVAVSDYSRDLLARRYPGANVIRVYNGMAMPELAPAPPASPPRLVSVGRLVEKKGFDVLIEACRLLKASGVKFQAAIIGEGPLREQLDHRILAAGLGGILELAGPQAQPEIRAALASASAFVLPCIEEKSGGMDILPTVITEAMAAGRPVVSTTLAGIPEMVLDGETGFLVPPGDALAVAETVAALLADPDRAAAMGRAGRKRAEALFAVDATIPQLLEALRSAAA
jgi:glycosyltransferase involved in cell wall biosynthesis